MTDQRLSNQALAGPFGSAGEFVSSNPEPVSTTTSHPFPAPDWEAERVEALEREAAAERERLEQEAAAEHERRLAAEIAAAEQPEQRPARKQRRWRP